VVGGPGRRSPLVQQIGPNQDAFFEQWASAVLPRFSAVTTA
jgi:hypothetical protein